MPPQCPSSGYSQNQPKRCDESPYVVSTPTTHTQELEVVMESKSLEGMRLAILATDGVEEAELVEPRQVLDNAGAKTTVLAPRTGKIQAMKHDEKTIKINVERSLDEADANGFDSALRPGGALN